MSKIKKESWFKAGVLAASWGVGVAASAIGFPYVGIAIISSGTAYASKKTAVEIGKKLWNKGKSK